MQNDTKETYLGDGLYASFDGFQIQLRAPRIDVGDQFVYLEPRVALEFVAYASKVFGLDIKVNP